MNKRAQGALEYLLLIGGAILVAAIVTALLIGVPGVTDTDIKAKCAFYNVYQACYGDSDCKPITQAGGLADETNFFICIDDTGGGGVPPGGVPHWHLGAARLNCTQVCSTFGGTYSLNCTDNDSDCSICQSFIPGAICGAGEHQSHAPFYEIATNTCQPYTGSGTQGCGARNVSYRRLCACVNP